jgi:hypothetical protein
VPDEEASIPRDVTGGPEGASAPDDDGPLSGPGSVPLDVDGVRTVVVGTAAWAVAVVTLLAMRTRLDEHNRGWWVWVCVAGLGLGLLGYLYCVRRRDRLRGNRPAAR